MTLVVAAAAGGVYLPTLGAEFVYDDVGQIEIDDYIHNRANLPEVLSLGVLSRDVLDNNRPVMLLSLMVDSMFWGRNPLGYHLTNLLLHAACSVLLLLLLLRIFGRLSESQDGKGSPLIGALVGALIFAVHPANSEAVCVASFREDLLVAFFALVALSLAERFPARRRSVTILLAAGCVLSMLAAVASKESGAVVPLLLLAYWLILRRREQRRAWAVLIGAGVVVTVAFLAARFALEPEHSKILMSKPGHIGGSFAAMLKIQPRIWVFQFSQILWPGRFCGEQQLWTIKHLGLTFTIVSLAAVAAITVWLGRRNPGVWLGAAFYWLALMPVSNIIPIYWAIADRYLYFPMVGFCLAVGAVVLRLLKFPSSRRSAAAVLVATVIVCGALGVITVRQTFVWQSDKSFCTDIIARNPRSYSAYNNLGFIWFDEGEFDRARDSFRRACELAPGWAEPWAGMAITYEAMGRGDLAERALREAIRRDRRFADPPSLVEALIWKQCHAKKLQMIADRM